MTIGMPNVKSVVPNVSEYVRVTTEVAHGYGKYGKGGEKPEKPVSCPPFGNNWLGETRADRPAYPTPGYLARPFARAAAPNVNRRARGSGRHHRSQQHDPEVQLPEQGPEGDG